MSDTSPELTQTEYASEMAVSITQHEGCIETRVTESTDFEELRTLIDDLSAAVEETRIARCLVVLDESLAGVDTLDRHKLGLHAAKTFPRGIRIATVGPTELITHMFEATAKARGLTTRVFDNTDDAVDWLHS